MESSQDEPDGYDDNLMEVLLASDKELSKNGSYSDYSDSPIDEDRSFDVNSEDKNITVHSRFISRTYAQR
jgi:hypothetical protein